GVEGEGRLPARLLSEHLDDPSAGIATDAQGPIQPEGARGNDRHLDGPGVAELHHHPLAELTLESRQCGRHRLRLLSQLVEHGPSFPSRVGAPPPATKRCTGGRGCTRGDGTVRAALTWKER